MLENMALTFRVVDLVHQFFFMSKVREGVLGRLRKGCSHDGFTGSIEHRRVDSIDQGEPSLMLPIDFCDVYGVFGIPFQKCNASFIQAVPPSSL